MELEEKLLRSFVDAVDVEYSRQNSSQGSITWAQIQTLAKKLRAFENIEIHKSHFKTFIDSLLQYIELALCFISNSQDMEYKRQKQYASRLLGFIPIFFENTDLKNYFIQEATVKTLELFIHGDYTTVSKKELIKVYNRISVLCHKEIRSNTAKNIIYYLYKLMDSVATYGDYQMQSDIVETLFRIFGQEIRNNRIEYDLLPGYGELGNALKDISINNFDADVRLWLNRLNENSQYIFSIACKALMFGSTICECPVGGPKDMWVDFDLKENMMSFFTASPSNEQDWNPVLIVSKDVKKVEVKRQLTYSSSSENVTIISIHLLKPSISELTENQGYWNSLDKHVKMVISNDEKEKIIKLISNILPRVFGDTFSHTSARISDKIKQVYKPLGIKISKKKSTASDLSSVTSKSKSDIEVAAIHEQANKKSATRIAISPVSKSITDESSIPEIKSSKIVPDCPFKDYVSWTMTDFTRLSTRQTDNSEIFSSRGTSPDLQGEIGYWQKQDGEKVQDNIVTSSIVTEVDVHVPHFPGRDASPVDENPILQGSEVFSPSPIKISRPTIDFSKEDFHSVASEEVEQTRPDNVNTEKETISVFKMSEDLEFETAAENFDEETCKEDAPRFKEQQRKSHGEIDNVINKSINAEEIVEPNVVLKKLNDIDLAKSNFEEPEPLKQIPSKDSESNEDSLTKLRQRRSNTSFIIESSEQIPDETAVNENEIETQDTFEKTTQENRLSQVITEENNYSPNDSEDIFSRPTQEREIITQPVQDNEENFTELSLTVNVGISEQPYSQEIRPKVKLQPRVEEVQNAAASDEEDVIDLTNDEENTTNHKELYLNTPDLLNILAGDTSQSTSLKGSVDQTKKKTNMESEISEEEMPVKKKKPRTLIKTGKKQFRLDNDEEVTTKSDPVKIVKDSCEVTDIYTSKDVDTSKTVDIRDEIIEECDKPEEESLIKPKSVNTKKNYFESDDDTALPKQHDPKQSIEKSGERLEINREIPISDFIPKKLSIKCNKPEEESLIKPKRLVKTKKNYFESDDETELPKQHDSKQCIEKNSERMEINREIPTSDFIPKKLFIKCDRKEAEVVIPIKKKKPQKLTKIVNQQIDDIGVAADIGISTSEANKENTIANCENNEEGFPKKKKKLRKLREINNKQFDLDDADDETTIKRNTVVPTSEVVDEAEEALCEPRKNVDDQIKKKYIKRKRKSVRKPNKKAKEYLDLHDEVGELNTQDVPVQNEAKEVVCDQDQRGRIEEQPTGKANIEAHSKENDIEEHEHTIEDFSVNKKKQERDELKSVLNDHADLISEQDPVQNMDDSDNDVAAAKDVFIREAVLQSQRKHFEEEWSSDRDVAKLTTKYDLMKSIEASYSDDNNREIIQEVEDATSNIKSQKKHFEEQCSSDSDAAKLTTQHDLVKSVEASYSDNNREIVRNEVIQEVEDVTSNLKSQRKYFEEQCSSDNILKMHKKSGKLTTHSHDLVKSVEASYSDDCNREMARNEVIREVEDVAYDHFQKNLVEEQSFYNTNVRQSKRLLQKKKSSKKSLEPELQIIQENNSNPPTVKSSDLDLIQEEVAVKKNDYKSLLENFVFKGRKSPDFQLMARQSSPIVPKKVVEREETISPDVFDILLENNNDGKGDKTELNKSKSNTTLGSKKRKLFNPGSFSYLDDMRIPEQETPELDSPKDVVKTPKKRIPRMKKPTEVASAVKKGKTPRKSGQLGIEVKKRRTRTTSATGRSHGIGNGMHNGALRFLANVRERGIGRYELAPGWSADSGAEPQNSSSDEFPGLTNIIDGKKKVSRELPKRILDPKTPPQSSEYSWPELEVEPLHPNNADPSRKVKILQDIRLKPKRLPNEELCKKIHKKPRLEIEEAVPVPDFIGDVDSIQHSQDIPNEKGEDFMEESFKLIKFVIELVETKQDRNSLKKLKHLLAYAEKLKE